jgi:hypothetical protein
MPSGEFRNDLLEQENASIQPKKPVTVKDWDQPIRIEESTEPTPLRGGGQWCQRYVDSALPSDVRKVCDLPQVHIICKGYTRFSRGCFPNLRVMVHRRQGTVAKSWRWTNDNR